MVLLDPARSRFQLLSHLFEFYALYPFLICQFVQLRLEALRLCLGILRALNMAAQLTF